MTKAIILLIVIGSIALITSVGRVPTAPARAATTAEKAEAAEQQKEFDAGQAARVAKFATERQGIITQAKKLSAARKYREAADLGDSYVWAHDPELEAVVDPAREKLVAAAMGKASAERKKEGVRIGMSKRDVLESAWGKPTQINRTTTAGGNREQWVYQGHHSYLYFTEDVLTAIQN